MGRQAWKPESLQWKIADPAGGLEQLARGAAVSPLTAQVLHNRGLSDVDSIRQFIQPKMTDLIDPMELPGMEAAAGRVSQAIERGEKIVIYGDYDVDGMTATTIMLSCITMAGGIAEFYIPHRLKEGYGVNAEALEKIIAGGAKLIITVDCGISDSAEFLKATEAGVDVVITDHHSPPEQLPEVVAIVHPALPGSDHATKNPYLCGAGVAFKLAWQIARQRCGSDKVTDELKNFLLDSLCLTALGTIADIVPLVGENRIIATFGLRGLTGTKHIGMRALLDSVRKIDSIDAFHVGYVLAPRLNAAGRMGHAGQAVEMLTSENPAQAAKIAKALDKQNTQRQVVQREIATQAQELVTQNHLDDAERSAIVLACENWHGGVIGIVASRIVDLFNRPTVMIAVDKDGLAHGSARSVQGFNIFQAIKACREHLITYGGHAMAGGLKMRAENIKAFTEDFEKCAKDNLTSTQLAAVLEIDAEIKIRELDINTVKQLDALAPFGSKNSPPLIAARKCRILTPPSRIGRNGQTVNMVLQQEGVSIRAIGFTMGNLADLIAGVTECDIAGQATLNTFNGRTNVEIKLSDVRWDN